MEIVSEGSLESISRPASCDTSRSRDFQLPQKPGKMRGVLEELPPEAVTASVDEDVDSEDDLIISPVESDVVLEDMAERTATANSSVSVEEDVDEEEVDGSSEGSVTDKSDHVVQHEMSQDDSSAEANLDPKIRKGLERIRKLDAILADKLKKEKEVKTHRRHLEKMWREEITQLDHLREQEGHGKIELGVGHALALGPPMDDNLPAENEVESVPVTPLFATQPIPNDLRENVGSPSGISSSCDSWAEQDIDDLESKSSKKTRKRKGSKQSRNKGKEQNFVKRNIELAADAGNVIPMTDAEKKRLEELMSDETDLLMVENAYSEGLALPAGEGFTLDSESVASIADIDSKLRELVPQEEIDLLASQESWKPPKELEHDSTDVSSVKSVDNIGLGERILREEKEMREMKNRLFAIEAQLQTLYRQTGDESEAGLSEDILARLIDVSSRTTSRSTTVSESVMSALASARTGDEMILEEAEHTTPLAILDSNEDTRSDSRLSSQRSTVISPDEQNEKRATSKQSLDGAESSRSSRHASRSRAELSSRSSSKNSNRLKEHDNRPKSRT